MSNDNFDSCRKNLSCLAALILIFSLSAASLASASLDVSLSDQGTDTRNKTSGELLESGNLTVEIYDSLTGGNLVYSENFTGAIVNGSWNVMLGEDASNPLSLEYGKKYYKDYRINGEDASFQNLTGHTVDRQFFHSPLGDIADEDVNDSTNLTLGEKITFALGGMIDNIVNGWLRITGSLNVTGNMRVEDAGQAIFFVNSSSGRVGIGTDIPGGKLHVVGDEGTGMLGNPDPTGIILIGGAGNDGSTGTDGADISITGGSGGYAGVDPGGDGGDVIINPGSGGEGSPGGSDGNVVMANTAGKVGIGISNPGAKLHVNGSFNVTENISTPEICLDGDCQTSWPAGGPGGGWTNTTNDTYTYKNVGIGTSDPSAKLNVNGSVIIEDASGNQLMVLNASDNDTLTINPSDSGFGIVYINASTYIRGGTGDQNGDGMISNSDKNNYYNPYLEGTKMLTEEEFARADINGDGKVSWDDVAIWQEIVGLSVWSGSFWENIRNTTRNVSATYGVRSLGSFYVNGKLGVGDYMPDSELEVVGGLMVSNGTAGDGDFLIVNSSTGNVGIGTNVTQTQLDIAGDGSENLLNISDGGSDVMYIDSDGEIGVGTTSPGAPLHVTDTDGGLMLYLDDTGATSVQDANPYMYLRGNNTNIGFLGHINTVSKDMALYSLIDGNLRLGTNDSVDMVINSDGKVGIGNEHYQADAMLDVLNTGSGDSFRVDDSGDDDGTPFIIDSEGKVGIGTDSPSSKLNVNGTIIIEDAEGNAIVLVNTTGNGSIIIDPLEKWFSTVIINSSTYIRGGSGDANGDGFITSMDKNDYIQAYLEGTANLTEEEFARSDINGDGRVDWSDVALWAEINGLWYPETESYRVKRMEAIRNISATYGVRSLGSFYVNGKLGVGDYMPDSELEVVGGLMVSNGTAGDGDFLIVNSSTGNVGIGTTKAEGLLHVEGGIAKISTSDYDEGSNTGNALWLSAIPGGARIEATNNGDTEYGNLSLAPYGGKVGIGTTEPNTTLTVAGNITPSLNDTYSLGEPGLWWKDLYVGSNSLYIGGVPLREEKGVLKWGETPVADKEGAPVTTQETGATGKVMAVPDNFESLSATEICLNGDCRDIWPSLEEKNGTDTGGGTEMPKSIELEEICLNGECITEWPSPGESKVPGDGTGGWAETENETTTGLGVRVDSGDLGVLNGWIGTMLERFLVIGNLGYPLSLGADGVMDMIYISTSGDVGIGTSEPSAKLEVNGSIKARGTICDGEDNCIEDSNGTLVVGDDDWIVEGNDSYSSVSGNVGIGTEEPEAKLHINDTVKIEPREEAPACDENGMLYVDSSGALCYCDGSEWSVVSGNGECG